MFKLILIFLTILFVSCDEINKLINPESEYLIERKIYTSVNDQIIESGNEIKIIIPGKCLKGELELKVKKLNSVDDFNISKTTLGNNIFKINYKGNIEFEKNIQVVINFDKSKIPSGKTASNSVVSYVKLSGKWLKAEFNIDESNSKIIINLSKFVNKIQKSDRLLDSEGEIIIGDGYTTTDEGNQDNLLKGMNRYYVRFYSTQYPSSRDMFNNLFSRTGSSTQLDTIKLSFDNNKFGVNYDSDPNVDPLTRNPGTGFFYVYFKLDFKGELEANSSNIKNLTLLNCRKYFSSQYGWDDEFSSFDLIDLKANFISQNKDTVIYRILESEINQKVKQFDWKFIDYWNKSTTYTQNKGDLKKIEIVFIK